MLESVLVDVLVVGVLEGGDVELLDLQYSEGSLGVVTDLSKWKATHIWEHPTNALFWNNLQILRESQQHPILRESQRHPDPVVGRLR